MHISELTRRALKKYCEDGVRDNDLDTELLVAESDVALLAATRASAAKKLAQLQEAQLRVAAKIHAAQLEAGRLGVAEAGDTDPVGAKSPAFSELYPSVGSQYLSTPTVEQ
ncbi:MAG: hypothetical protein WBP03_05665 [Candidatus Saccharimonadales bacterium]